MVPAFVYPTCAATDAAALVKRRRSSGDTASDGLSSMTF